MKYLLISLSLFFGTAIHVQAQRGAWEGTRFTGENTPSVSLLFPKEPHAEEGEVETDKGTVMTYIYSYEPTEEESDYRAFTQLITRYPNDINSETMSDKDIKEMFDKSTEAMLANMSGKLISEKPVTYQGYPAREMHVKIMNGVVDMHIRTLLVKDRFIVLQAMTMMEMGNEAERLRFFDSLQIKP